MNNVGVVRVTKTDTFLEFTVTNVMKICIHPRTTIKSISFLKYFISKTLTRVKISLTAFWIWRSTKNRSGNVSRHERDFSSKFKHTNKPYGALASQYETTCPSFIRQILKKMGHPDKKCRVWTPEKLQARWENSCESNTLSLNSPLGNTQTPCFHCA